MVRYPEGVDYKRKVVELLACSGREEEGIDNETSLECLIVSPLFMRFGSVTIITFGA